MDIRDRLVKQAISHFWSGVSHDIFNEHVTTYAKLAIDALEKENGVTVKEWVSVKDRLPEENTTVIVATDNGIVFQCLYAYDGWDLWDDNDVNITHWQPMPQPPKVV